MKERVINWSSLVTENIKEYYLKVKNTIYRISKLILWQSRLSLGR